MRFFKDESVFKNEMLFLTPKGGVYAKYQGGNKWAVSARNGLQTAVTADESANSIQIYNKWLKAGMR